MGSDPAGLEGGPLVPARERRDLFRPDPGGDPVVSRELPGRYRAADGRLLGGSGWRARRLRGQGPGVRNQGRRGSRRRVGRGSGHLSDFAQAPHLRIPARGGAPAPAHQHVRRGGARPSRDGDGHSSLPPRARVLLGPHADHHGERRRGGRRVVPRVDAGSGQPAAHAGGRRRLHAGLLRQAVVSHRVGPAQRRVVLPGPQPRRTRSGQRSGPRIRTRAATWPSSG